MAKNIVGLFDTMNDAQATVQDLRSSGFNSGDIDFLANNSGNQYNVDSDANTARDGSASEAEEGAGFGATGGAALGGLAGLLVGLGALVIPGIGPVIGAGTLIGTLGTTALGAGIGAAAGSLVGALVGAGIPEEDAHLYAEGVRRGGALVSVRAEDDQVDTAVDIMQRHNVVDIDRRGDQYRAAGWERFDENAEPYDVSSNTGSMGDADTNVGRDDYDRSSKIGTAGGGLAGAATGAAIGSAGGPIGTVVGGVAGALAGGGVGAAGDAVGAEASDDESNRTTNDMSGTNAGVAYGSTTDVSGTTTDASYTTTGTTGTGTMRTDLDQGGEMKLPIVEEELRVGKREVERGGVRVFTRVEETPVNEQVTLREEHVQIDRRPVDQPVTDATTAFQEGTFEVRERSEEAIVDKQARVVEEVHVKKDVQERTETIQDSVRRTDVDVEEVSGETRSSGYTESGTIGAQGVTGNDEGVIERNASKLGNAAERATGTDLNRDGDVGQRDPNNNF